jgi:hypothetical protein
MDRKMVFSNNRKWKDTIGQPCGDGSQPPLYRGFQAEQVTFAGLL